MATPTMPLPVDVALVPASAVVTPGRVLIVVDQIRASTTITTALDLGCGELLLAGDLATARRLREGTDRLVAGEQQAHKPADFDFDNSPAELARADIRGRNLVLCTTNGTAVVSRLRDADHLLIGCLANARAVAAAALELALAAGPEGGITVVCAGRNGGFVLDDAIAAGVIVGRIVEAADTRGGVALTNAARAAVLVREASPNLLSAMTASDGGATLIRIGCEDDIAFCAREDTTATVPRLMAGDDLRVRALATATSGPREAFGVDPGADVPYAR